MTKTLSLFELICTSCAQYQRQSLQTNLFKHKPQQQTFIELQNPQLIHQIKGIFQNSQEFVNKSQKQIILSQYNPQFQHQSQTDSGTTMNRSPGTNFQDLDAHLQNQNSFEKNIEFQSNSNDTPCRLCGKWDFLKAFFKKTTKRQSSQTSQSTNRNIDQPKEKKCCRICEILEDHQNKFTKFGKCSHYFCESCLHQYLNYEIQQQKFRQTGRIKCPQQDCRQYFNPQRCSIFMSLNHHLRSKYLSIVQSVKNGLQIRCPSCKNGTLKAQKQPIKCNLCHKSFEHKEVFSSLYKNCPKCGIPIQKRSGCDHMFCDSINSKGCGHNFCYKCLQSSFNQTCKKPCSIIQQQQPPIYNQLIIYIQDCLGWFFNHSRQNCFYLRVLIVILFSPIILLLQILIMLIQFQVQSYNWLEQTLTDCCQCRLCRSLFIVTYLLLSPLHLGIFFTMLLIVCPIFVVMEIISMIQK